MKKRILCVLLALSLTACRNFRREVVSAPEEKTAESGAPAEAEMAPDETPDDAEQSAASGNSGKSQAGDSASKNESKAGASAKKPQSDAASSGRTGSNREEPDAKDKPEETNGAEGNTAAGIDHIVAQTQVNIRSMDSTEGDIVGLANAGDVFVRREARDNGWSLIEYGNGTAFVRTEFFSVAENGNTADASGAGNNGTQPQQDQGAGQQNGTGQDAAQTAQQETQQPQAAQQETPQPQAAPQQAPGFDDSVHNYYRGMPADMTALAEQTAQSIAQGIMSNGALTSDLARVNAAAQAVAAYCASCQYATDTTNYYQSPVGVFVAGVYTCAGSTRALGRVLDYMGYGWSHVNENQYSHQWCIVNMDGQTGFADGMGGFAGYGRMYSGMQLPDGRIIYF